MEKAGVCFFKNDSLPELEGTSEVICHNPLIIHRTGETDHGCAQSRWLTLWVKGVLAL